MLEDAADITSVLARDGRRIFISSGIARVLGFTEEEALAVKMGESTHPDDRARVAASFRALLATPGAGTRVRFRQLHKDGSYRVVDAVVRNACDDPDVGGVVVNTRDVTEQLKLEEQFLQAQKLETVGRLAGGVAHDFNNLLTVILSCAELLGELPGVAAGGGSEYVEEIVTAGERARDLTGQLLAFARKQVAAPVALDVGAQVRATEKILRRLVGEDVAIEVRVEQGLWPVLLDPAQLDQVLFNLVVNARDAMPGGGHIVIEAANVPGPEAAADAVRLAVRDTGSGMSPEVQRHLFEPFFTTKAAGKGTGLGLATVHGIVQQHGGRVRVETAPGAGATFELVFPRCAPGAPPEERRRERSAHAGAETVLLVEDDPAVRHLAARALRGAGYRVTTAADGAEAIRLLGQAAAPPDLVVTDVVMPNLDGRKLAEHLRNHFPATPVLFTSGYSADRLASGGLLQADIDLLPKPFTPSLLLQRVRAALDRSMPAPPGGAR
ncbi:MAG: response regulator [Deltaproteobacteria bacterium]|nr:response regulator [Deltaproteobacteria bacterium]